MNSGTEHPAASEQGAGFEGALTGLPLTDVIQLNSQARFSGCVSVAFENLTGHLHFKDGDIVHAEAGSLRGEDACYEVLSWPGGRFSIDRNVATTQASIKRSVAHLLLEGARLMDERRLTRKPATPPPIPTAAARPQGAGGALEALKRVPGVTVAAIETKDGVRVGPATGDADALVGQTQYLGMMARRMADVLQAGELHYGGVAAAGGPLLVLATKTHVLSVRAEAGAALATVEQDVRRALAAPK